MRVFASIVLASVAEDDSLLLTVQGQSENGVTSDDISMLQRDRNKKHPHDHDHPKPGSKPKPDPKPEPAAKPKPGKPLPPCKPVVQRAIKDDYKAAQLDKEDLDLIICPWFKMVVRQNMEGGANLFSDNTCINAREVFTALLLSGLDAPSATLFTGSLLRMAGMQNPEQDPEARCLNPFALNGVGGEHGFDTGLIDPLPNKRMWYNSVASHAKTGKLGKFAKGRKASRHGKTPVTIDDFFASEKVWRMNQGCQLQTEVDVVGDIGVTPFPVFGLVFDMMGEGTGKEVTVKKMFDFTFKGKVDKFPFPQNVASIGMVWDPIPPGTPGYPNGGIAPRRSPFTAVGVELDANRATETVAKVYIKDPTFLNVTCQRLGLGVKLEC